MKQNCSVGLRQKLTEHNTKEHVSLIRELNRNPLLTRPHSSKDFGAIQTIYLLTYLLAKNQLRHGGL